MQARGRIVTVTVSGGRLGVETEKHLRHEVIVDCPGCDTPVTIANAGGYQAYCERCVEVIPPLPGIGFAGRYYLRGRYPNFRWEKA